MERSGSSVAFCLACAAAVTLSNWVRATYTGLSELTYDHWNRAYLLDLTFFVAHQLLCRSLSILLSTFFIGALEVGLESVLFVWLLLER